MSDGLVDAAEADRIGKEIMAICYQKQRQADFNLPLAKKIANDEGVSPDVLRQWLRAALEAMG